MPFNWKTKSFITKVMLLLFFLGETIVITNFFQYQGGFITEVSAQCGCPPPPDSYCVPCFPGGKPFCCGGSGGGGCQADASCPEGTHPVWPNPDPNYNACVPWGDLCGDAVRHRDYGVGCGYMCDDDGDGSPDYTPCKWQAVEYATCVSDCNTTAPTNIQVVPSAVNPLTSADITWMIGANGTSQKIYVGRNKNKVENNCTGGGAACVVNTSVGRTITNYTTGPVLSPGVVYYYRIVTYKDSSCESASATVKAISSCSLSPSTMTLQEGDTQTLTASVANSGEVDKVTFQSLATNYVTVNPAHPNGDSTYQYQTQVMGVAARANPVTVRGRVYFTGQNNPTCTSDASVTVTAPGPWWQVKDSDIQSMGNISSKVISGEYFDLAGSGGYPGVVAYTGSASFGDGSVSVTGWIAQSPRNTTKTYDYNFFASQIPQTTIINPISVIDQTTLTSGAISPDGYYWYKFQGAGDANIGSNINIGSNKVILLVESGNLTIGGNITLDNGIGFFGAFVDGNMQVSPSVGGAEPNLEGIYFADGSFSTGTTGAKNDSQLSIRGSIAAYGGVTLQRDLGDANTTTPAEFFEYAPDQVFLFPSKLSYRRIDWKEVAP